MEARTPAPGRAKTEGTRKRTLGQERPRPILSTGPTIGATDEHKPAAEKPRRSFATALKEAFGKLAEAVTGKPTPALVARRKRRDEGERGFRMYAPLAERLPAPVQRAVDYLWDVLDSLNPTGNANQPHPHEQLDQLSSPAQHYETLHL
jgi:hypothetical protein